MKRRDLLAVGGAVLGGGTVLGTGAITQSEVTREGDIAVSGDSNAYLRLSQPVNPTNAIPNLFDGRKDTVVTVKNQLSATVTGLQVNIDETNSQGIITGTTPSKEPIGDGDELSISAQLTATEKNPVLNYTVSANAGKAKNGDDISIDATRERDVAVPSGIASLDISSSDDTHVFRVIPSKLDKELDELVVTYPTDFDIGPTTATVRVGSSTTEISIDSSDLASNSENGNRNEVTIAPDSSSNLDQLQSPRVLQVNYGSVDNGSSSFDSIDVSVSSTQSNSQSFSFNNFET